MCIEYGEIIRILLTDACNALIKRPSLRLRHCERDANARLNKFDSAMEELRRCNGFGAQPLGLLEHTHGKRIRGAPQIARTNPNLIRIVLVLQSICASHLVSVLADGNESSGEIHKLISEAIVVIEKAPVLENLSNQKVQHELHRTALLIDHSIIGKFTKR